MRVAFLLKGLLIGFAIAAPVGPVGLLCIQRTVAYGRKSGLVSGLGAATADGVYGLIAGFGLTAVSALLIRLQLWVRLIGGAFLVYLGIKIFLSPPAETAANFARKDLTSDYGSTMFLTIANPITILSFAAIFAGAGLVGSRRDFTSAAALVAGVVLGSAAWWTALSAGVSIFRARFTGGALRWVNRIAGAVLVGFALVAFGGILNGSR